ncbi:hypothetical protein IFR05_015570 [Cadophora sp. M221]|nr:hypothetical protein IFR05_015570 [Cadophora sp. M221]
MMQSIIEDQKTAARAYFLCVIGMLVFESLIRLPQYVLILRNRGRPFVNSSPTHSRVYTYIHKLSTLPSLIPFITNHRLPNLLRLGIFIGLNILWGWNRIKFTTDYKLYGWLTISNGGLGLLLAARSNLFSHIFRIPSSTLLMYHRWIGRATITHATIHFALNTQHNIETSQLSTVFNNRRIIIGITAWISLCIIYLTSLSFIRRRSFEVFYYSHFLFIVFVIGACIHAPEGPQFLLPGLGLWVVDRGIRFAYNFRPISVKNVTVHDGDLTKFKLGGIRTTQPGQTAWVQIQGVSWLTWHPFTIASSPGEEDAVIAIRGLGGYTKEVQRLALNADDSNGDVNREEIAMEGAKMKIRIDGPYGVGAIRWGMHPVTVLVAGGIGITPGISIASNILKRASLPATNDEDNNGSDRQWHIHMLWIVKSRKHIAWFEEELGGMVEKAKVPGARATFDITIHVTGSVEGQGSERKVGYEAETPNAYGRPGVMVQGRPDVSAWFSEVKAKRRGLDTVVSACGPRSLIAAVRKAAAKVSGKDGLFHVEEEVFEL